MAGDATVQSDHFFDFMRQGSNSIETNRLPHSARDVLAGLALSFSESWTGAGQGRPAHLPPDAMPRRPAVRAEESGRMGRSRGLNVPGRRKNTQRTQGGRGDGGKKKMTMKVTRGFAVSYPRQQMAQPRCLKIASRDH